MKAIAVIFAGGTGQRMNSKSIPKQFLKIHGKPIIIHTLEHFENHPRIKGIVVVSIHNKINYMKELIHRYSIQKVLAVVPGGKTGQLSIYNGLKAANKLFNDNPIVLIHDGVRPLITCDLITKNIEFVIKYGSAISSGPAIETVLTLTQPNNASVTVLNRDNCLVAKAPQSFYLKDILTAHENALAKGLNDIIDSAAIMQLSNHTLHSVLSNTSNIKITTPIDFYMFKAILDSKENSQLYQ